MARGKYETVSVAKAKAVLSQTYGEGLFNHLPKDVEVRVPVKAKRLAGIGIWLNGIRLLKIKSRMFVLRKEFAPAVKCEKGTKVKEIREGRLLGYPAVSSFDWAKFKSIAASIPARTSGTSKMKEAAAALLS